jgi:hypothetical protein
MRSDLDRQLREYSRHMDEKQGALSVDDILERSGELQVIPKAIPRRQRQQLSQRSRWIAAAAAAVAVLVVVIGIGFLSGTDRSPGPVDQPTTTLGEIRSDFPASGPVEPGTYHIPSSPWNVAGFTMTMPEGWETAYGSPGAGKASDSGAELGFYFVLVDATYSDPCVGSAGTVDELREVGPTVDDLAQALLEQPHTVATGPVDTTLGGLPAKRIDLTVADDPETATCNVNVPGHLQIWYSPPVDDFFVLLGDARASVYILDVNGERQVFVTQVQDEARAEDLEEMQTIIDSIQIDT